MISLKKIALVLFLLLPGLAIQADEGELRNWGKNKNRIAEVHILSIDFHGGGLATVVARPCDAYMSCDNIVARVDHKTALSNERQAISYQEARKLDWTFGLIIVDPLSHAIALERMETGDTP